MDLELLTCGGLIPSSPRAIEVGIESSATSALFQYCSMVKYLTSGSSNLISVFQNLTILLLFHPIFNYIRIGYREDTQIILGTTDSGPRLPPPPNFSFPVRLRKFVYFLSKSSVCLKHFTSQFLRREEREGRKGKEESD